MNIDKTSISNISQNQIKKRNNEVLKTTSRQSSVSFKGSATLFTQADKQILNVFSKHYGNVGERLGEKVAKLANSSDILKKSSRFSLEQGALSIKEKSVGRSLFESAIFPFVNLPLYAANWVVKKAQSIPAISEKAKKIYNEPVLRIPRKMNELDSKTDMIKGIFDKTQDTVKKFAKEKGVSAEYVIKQINKTDDNPKAKQLVKEANEYIKENLYKVSNKFFDKNTGNFNTAYERPLNRIVSGLVPVAFLANDAYNLSVLCGDKKEVSEKEAKDRKKQEISRVFTTAYIQLITFGAFTKQVNTKPYFTPLTSAATVLFSEITSRKRLGKPIFFLSKEKAKEFNRKKEKTNKENIKPIQPENKPEQIKTVPYNVLNNNENIFSDFNASAFSNINDNKTTSKDKSDERITQKITSKKEIQKKETQKKETQKKENKALINFKTLEKAVAILVASGFVLSFLKNSSYTKNSKIVKGVKSIGNFFKEKVYNPLVYKDFEISKENFEKVTKSLKDSGCKEIAEGHEFIKDKYAKQSADGIIKMYKASLPASKIPEIAKTTASSIKSKGIELTEKEYKQIEESIKTAVNLHGTDIAEKKYTNVAKQATEIITKKNKNIPAEQVQEIVESITNSISANIEESPIKIEKKIKPFVDILTEPFKFILSALKLPFNKVVKPLINLSVSKVEKKAAKAALGEAELSKVEKGIHKAVIELFGEKQEKTGKISQTVFVNAIEKLKTVTKPYIKAETAYQNAIMDSKSSALTIDKLKTKLDKEKDKLMVYVNKAVEKSFNSVTQSNNKNTDLAMMSKIASSLVTSAFLVADNYNMVMIKSDGEDKDTAKEKANERIIQRLSALFYQTMLINWFNSTFKTQYNSSLKGMTSVVIPNTLTTEVLTRKSIGMPVGRKTKEQLDEIDEKNESRTGIIGKYFKFMRLLTGKKPLKDRLPKEKTEKDKIEKENSQDTVLSSINKKQPNTTNVLELLSK